MSATNTYFSIASLPTLPTSSHTTLIAGWLREMSLGDAFPILVDTGTAGLKLTLTATLSGLELDLSAFDSGGSSIFDLSTLIELLFFSNGDFHSFAVSVDTATQLVQLLIDTNLTSINNADPDVTWHSSSAIAFYPLADGWQMGPIAADGIVTMSDFRFGAGEGFFDLSVPDNALKIASVDNSPVPWGSQGQNITGQIPAVYLHGFDASSYAQNLGSGGVFTVHGTVAGYSPELCDGAPPAPPGSQIVWVDETGAVIVDGMDIVRTAPPL